MSALFLSYRRLDTQEVVGRIYDRLTAHSPGAKIFRDLESIPLGMPFPKVLKQALSNTTVGLVVIGPRWLSLTDERGKRRIEDPADFVRLEVEALLGMGIPVIPCLVSGASMPAAHELPSSIRPLVERQSVLVRPDPDFHRDMDRLIGKLAQMMPLSNVPETTELVLVRKVEGWWDGLEMNDWFVVVDGKPAIKLQGRSTMASAVVPSGNRSILVEWRERERGSNDRSGYWPGYYSSGQTGPVTLDLRAGRHIFTLVKEGPDPRTWWKQFLRGNTDDRQRSLSLIAFEPPGWPIRDKYLL